MVLTPTLAASEPARPTLPAPAPLVALATASLFWPVTFTALTVKPLVVTTVSSLTTATLVEMPAFNATAAPTPTSVLPGSTWLPSAIAELSVSLALVTFSAPFVLPMVRPLATLATVVATPTFTPTAAATATPPASVVSSVFGAVWVSWVFCSLVLAVLPPAGVVAGALAAVFLPAVVALLCCPATF